MRYTVEHPERVRALCLCRPWARGADYVGSEHFAGYLEGLKGDWTVASQMFVRVVLGLSGAEADEQAALFRETCTQEAYLAYLDAFPAHDVTALLALIAHPTFVAVPTSDLFVDVELGKEVAASIPDAQLFLYGPDESFQERTAAFLAGVPTSRSDETTGATPGGFQTILFTDLEASTPLTQRLGDEAAQEILRGHNTTVRGALDEHGGREVKHTGDGIMASFPSAVSAVTAALQIQRELMGGEVRVRVGLNAGEPIAEDDDLFGLSVIKAARIADRAEPGQVLVSNVVMELCEGKTFEFARWVR